MPIGVDLLILANDNHLERYTGTTVGHVTITVGAAVYLINLSVNGWQF